MQKLDIKYRITGKAIPPRPVRLEIPGWAGAPDKRRNGSQPQPWHCPPFVAASTYGLELLFPYDTECYVVNEDGKTRFDWDYVKEPGGMLLGSEFGTFAPDPPTYYFFNTGIDLQSPPGMVLRTQPHPRLFTEEADTVPPALMGHVESAWWPNKLFIVFRVPRPGHRHIFRKNEPYAQIIFVPNEVSYELTPMTPEEETRRRTLEEEIRTSASYIAKNVWHNADGSEFRNHYKVLERAFERDGLDGVEAAIRAGGERHAAAVPRGKTVPEYLDLAYRYHRQGKYLEARDVYFHLLRLDPNNAEVASRFGILAASMGLSNLAMNLMTRAVALQPQSAAYHGNLGETLRRAGQLPEAEASFRSALMIDPNDPQARSNLGMILAQQGRLDEGLQLCRAALAIGSKFAPVNYRLGWVLAQTGAREEARKFYQAALAIDPRYADAWRGLQELATASDSSNRNS
jgi:tetratricopeptide (TPR) repeat protein